MNQVSYIKEQMVSATIFVSHAYLGSVIELCSERYGVQEQSQIIGLRTMLVYRMPLREIIFDFMILSNLLQVDMQVLTMSYLIIKE